MRLTCNISFKPSKTLINNIHYSSGMAEKYHWADSAADETIEKYPDNDMYITSSGITPSGKVHIGNFRDIFTSDVIQKAIRDKGRKAKLLFFWDDYDRFRKVPKGVPEDFKKYLGMPVSEVPNPEGEGKYADFFKKEFEETMKVLGVDVEFVHQAAAYKENRYWMGVRIAMQKRKEIAGILSGYKTQKWSKSEIEEYYPLAVYCEGCGKDTTEISEYDGETTITYWCDCGHEDTVDFSKKNVGKLAWKVDWAMRWWHYGVAIEPAGKDHATAGGSFDVSGKICRDIYGYEGPVKLGFGFVGFAGSTTKMSSSTGILVTPAEILKIYEPEVLRWLYARSKPRKEIRISFDAAMYKLYDEFDRSVLSYGRLDDQQKRAIDFAKIDGFPEEIVPFRVVASFGQVAQGSLETLKTMLDRAGVKYEEEHLARRLEKTMNWIRDYMPEAEIRLNEGFNDKVFNSLDDEEKEQIRKLVEGLEKLDSWTTEKIDELVYDIPKEPGLDDGQIKDRQRKFFRNIYQMLINQDQGPRLSTFLVGLGSDVIRILKDK